jgi:hypothetical protein
MKTCISTNFNNQTQHIAEGIINVAEDLRKFWPLTVRQIFYQLVAALIIPNNIAEYRKVSRIGVKLRELDILSWTAIEDRTRRTTDKRGIANVTIWLQEQLETFCNPLHYQRCYVQQQSVYCEVTTEKDALSRIMETETYWFCTRLNVVRGQVSATMVEQIANRVDKAIMKGQTPIILHFGDLDPSGIAIPKALQKNLLERHDIDVEVRPVALTPEQIYKYDLPLAMDAIKMKDPNYGEWLNQYGPDQAPVELDSLRPDIIQEIMRESLSSVYDMSRYENEKQIESKERELLEEIKFDVEDFLLETYPKHFNVGY